jgi:beta-mannosidase
MTSSANRGALALPRPSVGVEHHEVHELSEGWQAAPADPALAPHRDAPEGLSWVAARVPGTAAAALRDAGEWSRAEERDFDTEDWWFRTSFQATPVEADEEVVLCLQGIATVAEVYLNGELILQSESMFARYCLNVGALLEQCNELAIRCRALSPLLEPRRRPRARWRTRVVPEGNLRFFRTMLLGRAPGFAPGPAAVGPWRGVSLQRRRRLAVEELTLRAAVSEGAKEGRLAVRAILRSLNGEPFESAAIELSGPSGTARASLSLLPQGEGIEASGELLVPDVALWWPHTHGEPALYEARIRVRQGTQQETTIEAGRVGFRNLAFGRGAEHEVEADGIDLHINGVQVFARGCLWTPIDPIGLAPSPAALRSALEQVRDAGMNMLRIPGTSTYESELFHDLCDELGILLWQDFMFANFDYPVSDDTFRATVTGEARQILSDLASRPSLAILCGNSEVEQQVAMLGLEPAMGRGELFGEILPGLVAESATEAAYLPSAPCGGELPFRTDRGVANYYGVGGYRRPLEDARRAEVRFAAECLAFSNVPDEAAIEDLIGGSAGGVAVHDPRWKAGVPRDVGSGWDFEDVRDHYLELLFGVDAFELRAVDPERYLELSRTVTGEVMAEVFGEWRRGSSPCGGALVLWLRDLVPGAGWGVLDHRGSPKVAYHHLRRALAPSAVWMSDEGLNGVDVHVANDGSHGLAATLRLSLYRELEHRVEETTRAIELPPHSIRRWGVEELLGRFVDASWAYRFGPPPHDLIVASLEGSGEEQPALISQAMRFPAGRPLDAEPATRLGLQGSVAELNDNALLLSVKTARLAYGVRLHVPGFSPEEDAFSVAPGEERIVALRPLDEQASFAGGRMTAVNLQGQLPIAGVQ